MLEAGTILKPEGYLGHDKGPRRYTVSQGQSLIGRRVEIRDWYGEIRATVTGLHQNELTGMLLYVDSAPVEEHIPL